MCEACDDPSYTDDKHMEWIASTIETYGWAVQYVEPGPGRRPPFAYTIGLTASGLPELALTGTDVRSSMGMLNDVGAEVVAGRALLAGERWTWPGHAHHVIEAVTVTTPAAHLKFACAFYGEDVRATQLVYCDDRGRWPWDIAYRRKRWNQPVLGPRTESRNVGGAL